MKRPTMMEGLGVALFAGLVTTILFSALSAFLPASFAFKCVIACLSMSYILYLLSRSEEKTGRVVISSLLIVASIIVLIWSPSLIVFLTLQSGFIWLARALYFYQSILSALADMGLTAIGFLISIWAWQISQSMFLALWCFFLIQSLFIFIPGQWKDKPSKPFEGLPPGNRFEQAHQAAFNAVRKLSDNL